MKKNIIILVCILFAGLTGFTQIGVNTDGTQPDGSAMLDVKSTTKGFLPPRLTTSQMNLISNPIQGLMVYNTTLLTPCWFNGTSWDCGNAQTCGTVFIWGGHTYNTVLIGQQCWMKENLNVGSMINAPFPQTNNGVFEKYCYNNIAANCDIYGGLYNWAEMMNYEPSSTSNPSGRQGICPTGWHIPGWLEWEQLGAFLGGASIAGGKMKETGTTHWASPNTGATNSSGFTGLPGGTFLYTNVYYGINTVGAFWSATADIDPGNFLGEQLYYTSTNLSQTVGGESTDSFSVRCVKN